MTAWCCSATQQSSAPMRPVRAGWLTLGDTYNRFVAPALAGLDTLHRVRSIRWHSGIGKQQWRRFATFFAAAPSPP
jgi:hypothetical protein